MILVAGGESVTALFPWLQHFAELAGGRGTSSQRVSLVQAMKRRMHYQWTTPEITAATATANTRSLRVSVSMLFIDRKHDKEVENVTPLKPS